MPNKNIWPDLPSGWSYGTAEQQVGDFGAPEGDRNTGVGSMFRQIAGPPKPIEKPSFLGDFVKPTATKIAKTLVPTTPEGIGMFLASSLLAGPGGPVARAVGSFAPEAVPALEALGSTGMRRVLGMGLAGAGVSKMLGNDALSGAASAMVTQLGGEAVSKLTRWASMNAQAKELAQQDPQKLGEVVSTIIPDLKDIKTANDFHAAFNSGGAQQTISQAYARDMADVAEKAGDAPIRSSLLSEMKGAGYMPQRGSLKIGGLEMQGARAGESLPNAVGGGLSGTFSFSQAADTLKRLRTQGWNQDEIARGLGARDAREAAAQLAQEITSQLPQEAAEKFTATDAMYARGRKLIDYLSDPKLLKPNGDLNIPRLQAKFKAEGYNPRQSLQMAADALALKESIFRGADAMLEDVPGEPGRFFDHVRVHFGIVPTMYPKMPQLGKYAGVDPKGLTAYGGTQLVELLKRGTLNRKPVSLMKSEDSGDESPTLIPASSR